jgi:hypothetical protein
MKVVMLAYHTTKDGEGLKPGDTHEGFDDAETERQIKIGGARLQTPEEIEAEEQATDAKAADAKSAALAAVNAAARRR